LLRLSWSQLFAPGRPRLGRVWTLGQMSARFGGQPEDYEQLFDALFLLCHGTATLLTVGGDTATNKEMRETCIKICDRMIENVAIFRS
jgi:hypothetical protein